MPNVKIFLAIAILVVAALLIGWIASRRGQGLLKLRWLRARLAPGERLGLYFTLGLGASILLLGLFIGIAEDVVSNDPIVQTDQAIAQALHARATPLLTSLFVLITDLGEPVTMGLLALLLAVLYARRKLWLHLTMLAVALGGGELLNQTLKFSFARPRPYFDHPLLVARGYSFPSGHAMGSVVFYGMLGYFALLPRRSWRIRTLITAAVTLLILLIGFSRMYLGVHYFSDVVGGYAAAGVWLSTCITGMSAIRRGEVGGSWVRRLRGWGARDIAPG